MQIDSPVGPPSRGWRGISLRAIVPTPSAPVELCACQTLPSPPTWVNYKSLLIFRFPVSQTSMSREMLGDLEWAFRCLDLIASIFTVDVPGVPN